MRSLHAILLLVAVWMAAAADPGPFRFVILGDRTGEAVPGVYEQVWREAAAENPAFVVSVGDSIQGLRDEDAAAEWQQFEQILKPYRRFPVYLAAGNHDIWSAASERLFLKSTGRALHFSFDSGPVHCTVLDNSRSDDFAPGELAFLEEDLQTHAAQPIKLIVSHRPSWLIHVAMQNTDFEVQRLARRYGVQYVVAAICIRCCTSPCRV